MEEESSIFSHIFAVAAQKKKKTHKHPESTWELYHVICYYQYISCRESDSRNDRDRKPQVFLDIIHSWSYFEDLHFKWDALKQLQRTIRSGLETGSLPTVFWTTWLVTFTTLFSNYTKQFEKHTNYLQLF